MSEGRKNALFYKVKRIFVPAKVYIKNLIQNDIIKN